MTRKIFSFLRKDFVFTIAAALALLSMVAVPPSMGYIAYFDFGVLCTLFCLMAVVAGYRRCGLLDTVSRRMLSLTDSLRGVSLMLVLLCFASSMLLTNDVALIAFVPLTLMTLHDVPPMRLIYIVVLETVAANLGSMLTPIGNPQNLYLYSYFQMDIVDFVAIVSPICAVSLVALLALLVLGGSGKVARPEQSSVTLDRRALAVYTLLFVCCLLTVLRLLDYRICTAIVVVVLLLFDRSIFAGVDYMLLCTFAAFFVLVGNLGNIPAVASAVSWLMQGRELLATALVSQVISNVPAVIMLSRFTDNAHALLLGGNIGGLGTLVASLASLISYKFYARSDNARPLAYLGVFSLVNFGLLALLLVIATALY